MPLEIEVKVKVEGHEGVREKLTAAGAVRKGKVKETNVFFDRESGELRRRDTGLRVRFTEAAAGEAASGEDEALLTVKGPAAEKGLRSREAYDVMVAPGEQIVPLLKMLGFEQVLLFEKMRETWELGGCLVELDEMPVFGHFVEVEGPSEAAVGAVQWKIGLGGVAPERTSYSKMVGEWVRERGVTELRFAKV